MSQFFSSLFYIPPQVAPILQSIWQVWSEVWWIVLPIITGMIFWEMYKLHLHYKFLHDLDWQLLEIKVPKNVLKTPKAMEQIFAAAHAPYSYGYSFLQKYWQGLEEYWMSFELVGRAGETHFYLRVPKQFRNMMESAIFGQYPEAEISEAEDYLKSLPEVLPNKELDFSGFEEVLRHPSYFPIRTYPMFEDTVEERRVDTMGALIEAISKLKNEEQLWLQVIIKPAGEKVQREGEEAIRKLLGLEEKKKKSSIWDIFDLGLTLGEVVMAPFQHPGEAKSKHEESPKQQRFIVAPHDKERAEAIQEKIAKISFESTIRFGYIERNDTVVKSEHLYSIHGYIRQFNTQDLNSLKPEKTTTTAGYAVKGLFKKERIHFRKRLLYEHYRHFIPGHHESVLNVEELATVFHFPITAVSTTELEKVESRKGTPPASLPVME